MADVRKYELYLDESGNFINEKGKNIPSLVGGLLVKEGSLSIEKAQSIMNFVLDKFGKNYVHINDLAKENYKLAGKAETEIIQNILKIPANIVIFQNSEHVDKESDKALYLDVISEGIVNLIERLSMEKASPVELNVIAAVRRDLKAEDEKEIIGFEDYSTLIKKKIYMRLAANNLFISKNCKVNFELSSARKNVKLMLADVICNAKYTVTKNKFDESEKEILNSIFKKSNYIFNIYKPDWQKKISEYLIQNNIVDVMFLLNEIKDEQDKNRIIRLIIGNIETMDEINLNIQIDLLSLKIRSLIDVQRNLKLCGDFLANLQDKILLKIKRKCNAISRLKLDVSLYLLTIFTHTGDVENCLKQIKISDQELEKINGSWDYLNYYYILKIRQAVWYMDCLNNEKAIQILNEIDKKFTNVLAAINEIDEFKNIKSDVLAKVRGTRLQAYTNLITINLDENKKHEYYNKAKEDSEYSINAFVSNSDKARQYQYRAMLEAACGNIDIAVQYLMKIINLNKVNFNEFWNKFESITSSRNFIVMNYFEIIRYAIDYKNRNIAEEMYLAYQNNKDIYDQYTLDIIDSDEKNLFTNNEKVSPYHPTEIIYWDIGRYFRENNTQKAEVYFDEAIKYCENMNEATIDIIGFAIKMDKLSMSKNINNDKTQIIEKYNNMLENEKYQEFSYFLNKIKDYIDYLEIETDEIELKKICRKVANEIKA